MFTVLIIFRILKAIGFRGKLKSGQLILFVNEFRAENTEHFPVNQTLFTCMLRIDSSYPF